MARHNPLLGPRSLTCLRVLKKDRALFNPETKQYGRCGECRTCWRLFVHLCRRLGLRIPKANKRREIVGFQFQHARKQDN